MTNQQRLWPRKYEKIGNGVSPPIKWESRPQERFDSKVLLEFYEIEIMKIKLLSLSKNKTEIEQLTGTYCLVFALVLVRVHHVGAIIQKKILKANKHSKN